MALGSTIESASNNAKPRKEGKAPRIKNLLKLDDLNVIPLKTAYDKQFYEGNLLGESASEIMRVFPLDDLRSLRERFIRQSLQDDGSNLKFDVEKWFLYPTPLPKFWKYNRDLLMSAINTEDTKHNRPSKSETLKAYYLKESDELMEVEVEVDQMESRKPLLYTGKTFNLDVYREKLLKHTTRKVDKTPLAIPEFEEFMRAFRTLTDVATSGEFQNFAYRKLEYLYNKFDLFQHLKSNSEKTENKTVKHRDFYNIRKIDTNMLLSGCVSERQLNEFIWDKLNLEPNRVVYVLKDGHPVTLRSLFNTSSNELDISKRDNTNIGLKAVANEFLDWYQTLGVPRASMVEHEVLGAEAGKGQCNKRHFMFYLIAKTFLDFDNYINGEYFAELIIRYVIENLEQNKYQLAQLSVDFRFERSGAWWSKFAAWVCRWKLVSYSIRWNVRIKRDYPMLYQLGHVKNFGEYLDSVFDPLTDDHAYDNVELQFFLSTVCHLDLVVEPHDEYSSQVIGNIWSKPDKWGARGDNPPVAYYMYYIYQKLAQVNYLRNARSQNTISLRSYYQCDSTKVSQFNDIGITEQLESLLANFLLCHGGLLRADQMWYGAPVPAYLYYLFQIPLVVSPLSPFVMQQIQHKQNVEKRRYHMDLSIPEEAKYTDNPFILMHKVGFRVVLSCNMVLFNNSYTSEPIAEEYSVAASIHLLSAADLSEFVRNSVFASSFEGYYKKHWIGVQLKKTSYMRDSFGLVDIWYDEAPDTREKHNLPRIRRNYRMETLKNEWQCFRLSCPIFPDD
ncbi:HBR367Cp [Eremothecium sinecaudum]|uniref:HBR367Cp n=1 Tax=Eremothecium sinecaudum TaxID=45286 RepID=A0A109UXH0_9SACH|nr:HBR367Cp [Eremothecium sinecaudum]AMD19268.1 HBR367Cp [Eremothecium sinecaudum]